MMSDRAFERFAGCCAFYYVAAQTFQYIVRLLWLPQANTPGEQLLANFSTLDQARAVLLIFAFIGMIPVFQAIAGRCREWSPQLATTGLIFGVIWVATELLYRGPALFLISRRWGKQYAETSSAELKATLLERFQVWNHFVIAWYFVLLLTLLVTSVAFFFALKRSRERFDRFVAAMFALEALHIFARLVEIHGEQTWLTAVNRAVYYPLVLLIFGTLGVWLVRSPKRDVIAGQ